MDFMEGYLEAASGGKPVSPESTIVILEDCVKFDAENKKFLLDNYICKFKKAGRDFWFARQRLEINPLTPFCKKYPPVNILNAKDGTVFLW